MSKEILVEPNINLCWKPCGKNILQKTPIGSLCEIESISPENEKAKYIVLDAPDWVIVIPELDDCFLMGSGAITVGELGETIKSQQYEITQLRKEINLLRTKLSKAVAQGFRL